MKWIIVIWILLGWSSYPLPSDLWAAQAERVEKELSEKKGEFERIKKNLLLKQKEKEDILRKEFSIRKSLNRTQKDLHKKEKVLKQKRAGLDQIKRRIRDTENYISILARDVKKTENKLGSDLQTLYKVNRVPPEAYLISLSSCGDFLKVDKYLRTLVEHQTELTKAYKHELVLKLNDKRKLVRNRIQWQQSIYEEEKKKEKVRKLRKAEQAKLKSTLNQKATSEKSITEIEKRSRLIQSLIDKLERERRVLSYGKSKYGMLKGKLRLPVQGKVVSLFKEREQNGIEIKASIGAPVRAILPGKVVYADWFKGFENLIIIDHGDGMLTISGNCSKLIKKRGDTVSEGEIIARVGNSESDRAPSFYFEIRHRGKPQDPLEWISNYKKSPKGTDLE
ncbi:MAG: peptidoglycan DD-metalloendopeptidase family protein [Deltaproteobacteria bacterium]|nr:peptidoglycan DD-metalloendopeptidase family protein [Deltaproteobacteria bacterium]